MPKQPSPVHVIGVGMTKFLKPRGKVDCELQKSSVEPYEMVTNPWQDTEGDFFSICLTGEHILHAVIPD
jgi:hypothetical protein